MNCRVALVAAKTLSLDIRHAIDEWRALGQRLIYAYLGNSELLSSALDPQAVLRVRCLGTVLPPIIFDKFPGDLVKPSLPYAAFLHTLWKMAYNHENLNVLRLQLLRDDVKLVFAIRSQMRDIHDTDNSLLRSTIFLSIPNLERYLLQILNHKHDGEARPVERFYSVAAVAGISYDELLRPCLIPLRDSPSKVDLQMAQMGLLSVILMVDKCKDLLDAYLAHRVTAYVASLMRSTWDVYYKTLAERDIASDGLNWHDRMIQMWSIALDTDTGARVATVILEAKYLFLLERWSVSASGQCLGDFPPCPSHMRWILIISLQILCLNAYGA